MSLDAKSAAIGAGVAIAGLVLMGKSKSSGKSGKKKSKGLGATYLVSGTAKKVTKRAAAVRKAAAGGAVKATRRKRTKKAK